MIRIGILCPAEIAYRRFLPALQKSNEFCYVGVGIYSYDERTDCTNKKQFDEKYTIARSKADCFVAKYGGKIWNSYEDVIRTDETDAIYIPLPPALHYDWALKAIKQGKHVLIEKPSTLSLSDSKKLVCLARKFNCCLKENYMFIYHKQLWEIRDYINKGNIGRVRLYRINFGFPKRNNGDFRYNNKLGGGALFDAGGYVLRYASMILGDNVHLKAATINYEPNDDVDLFGSGTMENDEGIVVQFAYGMDNEYKCELEVWGSKGYIKTDRVLTAPDGLRPKLEVWKNGVAEEVLLSSDDTFFKSLQNFNNSIINSQDRADNYMQILKQAKLVEDFKKMAFIQWGGQRQDV